MANSKILKKRQRYKIIIRVKYLNTLNHWIHNIIAIQVAHISKYCIKCSLNSKGVVFI